MKKIDKKTGIIGLGFLLAGLFLGWLFFGTDGEVNEVPATVETETLHEHENAVEIWTCSMHPQIREAGPGQCPICGMDLIPLAAGSETVGLDEVQMTEAAMKIADVQTVTVDESLPEKIIYLPGKVQADERRLKAITSRFPGRIEELYIDFTGQEVRQGQRLASIYSPELIQAQKELLEAASFRETNPSFYQAAVNKLKLWNISEDQIQSILENEELEYSFDIYATQSGTVVEKMVNEGDYVSEGQPLLKVAGLDKVWVLFDAYENDLTWIEEGDEIAFTVQSIPGEVFSSEVVFIDPVINPQTRVASVRTEVENSEGELKPGMFAEGIIESTLEGIEDALIIPKSAILWTGKRAVVYVKDPKFEQPTFEYREVILGPEAGDYYVVNAGLEIGEEVVANGVFKIDAAAQLNGKRSMMNPVASQPEMPPMPGMDMAGGQVQVETAAFVEAEVADLSQDLSPDFKEQMNNLVDAYLVLKEALVAANEEEIPESGELFLEALHQLDATELDGEAKAFLEEKKTFLIRHAKQNQKADNLAAVRQNFIYLSHPLIKLVEAFGANEKLYIDFCPMANNNKGAFWLSSIEEIRNPYMPETMRTCGSVKKVI